MADHTAVKGDIPARELTVADDTLGKVADFLPTTELEPAERNTLDKSQAMWHGQSHTPRVTAVHRHLLTCKVPNPPGRPLIRQLKVLRHIGDKAQGAAPAHPAARLHRTDPHTAASR
ncbi:hypothetical protein [Streptomyces sp. MBT27]|uniref:hypothetical protein n=1 Tax=Streptomyces sp. MBT27 TaxID=1488356 RepID=UPI0014212A52|nr:hypothetical protein [Streptomyces sp. MBT27]